MARKPGQLIRCTCTKCGEVELRTGCNSAFKCATCDPNPRSETPAHKAHRAVAKAIAAGALVHPSCFACADCGKPAIEYDHRDYAQPLTVDPVCRRCNLRRGRALNA